MNKFICLILVALCFSCNKPHEGYLLTGKIKDVKDGTLLFIKVVKDRKAIDIDTAIVNNESFEFKGHVNNPDLHFMIIDDVNSSLAFILENTNLDFTLYKDSLNTSLITGSKENDLAQTYTAYSKEMNTKLRKASTDFRNAKSSNDTLAIKDRSILMENLKQENNAWNLNFLKANQNTLFASFLLENLFLNKTVSAEETYAILESMTEEAKKFPRNIITAEKIEAEKKTMIGATAPSFSGPTPEGKELDLSEINGKITILDFWAAWCGPCRRENPNFVNIYEKYHDKGLEIISISLDGNTRQKDPKTAWIKAIKDDKLTWHHISNLNYFNGPIAKQYNINSIPATFILDENKKIIAKNLRGAALEEKIAELLNTVVQ